MKKLFLFLLTIAAASPVSAQDWRLTGNSNTLPTDYLGTSDARDFVIKTAAMERMRISTGGTISIAANSLMQSTTIGGFKVLGDAGNTALNVAYGFNNETGLGMFRPIGGNLGFAT